MLRVLDLMLSIPMLIILLPVLLVIALAIRIDSRGSIFYRAQRVGKDGKLFRLYKFRTMVVDADKRGPGITTAQDMRITKVGRFLRRTKLDEFPQLLNVILGDMSLVGPRPEDPRYVAMYSDEQRGVLAVRPGITSPASVEYRNEEALLHGDDWETRYIGEIMPAKLAIDLNYVRRGGVGRYFGVLFKTFTALWH